MANPKETGEFRASPETQDAGVDLESARLAYQFALETLIARFPQLQKMTSDVVESKEEKSIVDILNALFYSC